MRLNPIVISYYLSLDQAVLSFSSISKLNFKTCRIQICNFVVHGDNIIELFSYLTPSNLKSTMQQLHSNFSRVWGCDAEREREGGGVH